MEGRLASSPKPLDAVDRKILRVLHGNGRLSAAQLAEAVGLSSTPCWTRMRRLEEDGYIEGYVAILNQAKLGLPDTIMIEVVLDRHEEHVLDRFGEALADMPEVIEAYLMAGEYDYLIKVAVEGTAGYERFLREKLFRIPGIRHSRSAFTLRCLKRLASPLPCGRRPV